MAFRLTSRDGGRILQIGEIIKCKASIASDDEAKYWAPGKVKIRVLDENTIGVSWGVRKISLKDSVSGGSSPETSNIIEMFKMKWESEEERVFDKNVIIDLSDVYHKGPFFESSDKKLVHF